MADNPNGHHTNDWQLVGPHWKYSVSILQNQGRIVRVLRSPDASTQDLIAGRVNLHVNAAGQVERVSYD